MVMGSRKMGFRQHFHVPCDQAKQAEAERKEQIEIACHVGLRHERVAGFTDCSL